MAMTRRFVVLLALMVWQGGFMFYGAVTVPVTREKLDDVPVRSAITKRVTQWMNLIGTAAILAMYADLWLSAAAHKRRRWLAWLGMAVPHPLLLWLHIRMSSQMAVPEFHHGNPATFSPWHQAYMIVSTVQWLAGMVFALLTLRAWREEDRATPLAGSRLESANPQAGTC